MIALVTTKIPGFLDDHAHRRSNLGSPVGDGAISQYY
jgi:hypothetical protein